MEFIEAIILGIIQGLTEFLPISSSGHLEIGKAFFGNNSIGEESLFLTLVLHFATALSTIVVFKKEIQEILKGLLHLKINEHTNFSIKIIISMIPAIIVGLFFQDQIEALFSKNLVLVGSMLLLTSLILFLADQTGNTKNKVSFSNSFILGVVQAIAILPGISRSGSTIASALLLGIDRQKASRFSFLMVLPLIFGSMVKTLIDMEGVPKDMNILNLALAFTAAFISGIFACRWIISVVKKSKLKYFSYYCVFIGVVTLIYGLF
ncbi:MAG: UDP-diphosphatase [Flavobacteriaceae bacterium TMED179]|nr:MAG: UDP-diphosphatase [Flavobacteriaceae bacterium TMED179]